MTYSTEAIQALIDRVGWANAVPPSSIAVSTANHTSDSGLYFRGFHPMATIENVNDFFGAGGSSETDLNAFAYDMKNAAANKVLMDVFQLNVRASYTIRYDKVKVDVSSTDYSSVILTKPVFDNAYGYRMAIDVLELMLNTNRTNNTEKKLMTDGRLRLELEGMFNDDGKVVTKGLYAKYQFAITTIIDVLFPEIEQKPFIRNASNMW